MSAAADADHLLLQTGRRIAQFRRQRGLTQASVAHGLGMAHKNLQRIESGRQNVTLRTLHRLAGALEVQPFELLQPPADDTATVDSPRALSLAALFQAGWRRASPATPAARTVPAYDLRAFAGPVGDLRAAEPLERLRPPPGRRLRLDGLFLARATGHSMEPSVPHGSWCLLRQPPAPPLLGKVVLVQHGGPDASDGVGGWQIKRVTRLDWSPDGIDVRLSGDNPEAAPVDLHILSEDGLVVAGELVEVAAAPDADPTPR